MLMTGKRHGGQFRSLDGRRQYTNWIPDETQEWQFKMDSWSCKSSAARSGRRPIRMSGTHADTPSARLRGGALHRSRRLRVSEGIFVTNTEKVIVKVQPGIYQYNRLYSKWSSRPNTEHLLSSGRQNKDFTQLCGIAYIISSMARRNLEPAQKWWGLSRMAYYHCSLRALMVSYSLRATLTDITEAGGWRKIKHLPSMIRLPGFPTGACAGSDWNTVLIRTTWMQATALLMLDLDRFKEVNAIWTFGGDELLQQVAQRITARHAKWMWSHDWVAMNLSYCWGHDSPENAARIAKDIVADLRNPSS